MIVMLEPSCPIDQTAAIVRLVEREGGKIRWDETEGARSLVVVGCERDPLRDTLRAMPGVLAVHRGEASHPLVARGKAVRSTRVDVNGITVGADEVVVMAGPCAVEPEMPLNRLAGALAGAGVSVLRGGAFKPRSSPYSFQGLGEEGLAKLAEARTATGLRVVTEVVAPEDVNLVAQYADLLQVGARNMQNFRLLSALGAQRKPVLLKRGMMATLDELLMAAEYVAAAGNPRIILCERGIRTFETATRNTLDLAAVPVLKERTHLPVIVDPSHAAGRRELVRVLARAAVAAGADGLIVEVHHDPERALSDGRQSLTVEGLAQMMTDVGRIADAIGRSCGRRDAGAERGAAGEGEKPEHRAPTFRVGSVSHR